MVKKRFVFHFYLNEGWDRNYANDLHFKCLSRYSHIFDEAKIVISVDPENERFVNDVKKRFVECINCGSLEFKVQGNDSYYEGGTFKREVVDHLADLDGLLFFGHNKGVACLSTHGEYDEDSLAVWICAMYFYNLEFVDEVEKKLCVDTVRSVYGTLLFHGDWFNNASHMFYSGTFYWLSPGRVLKWAQHIPQIYDREYAEFFPGDVFGSDITYPLSSRCELIFEANELYTHARDYEWGIGKNDDDRMRFKAFLKDITGHE